MAARPRLRAGAVVFAATARPAPHRRLTRLRLAPRGAAFLAERILSQGGGLLFTACLARGFPAEEAAGFVAAYAFASLLQPLFANACQPLAAGLWRRAGAQAFVALWTGVWAVAALSVGAMILWRWAGGEVVAALLLLHTLASPAALASAPMVAEDRWRTLVGVLIPVGMIGLAFRLLALVWLESLPLAAALFAVEPVLAGICFGRLAGRRDRAGDAAAGWRALRRQAPALMFGMGLATLFWRAPVLLSEAFLTPEATLRIAFATQAATGLALPAAAAAQSLFGRVALGGRARAEALGRIGGVAALSALAAAAFAVWIGDAALTLVYGPAASGAGALLIAMTPVAGLAALWRALEFAAAHDGAGRALLLTRLAALGPMAAGGAAAALTGASWPLALATGAGLFMAAVAAPLASPALRPTVRSLFAFAGRARGPAPAPAPRPAARG